MSYVVKGAQIPVLVSTFPQYNAETKTYSFEYEYRGTEGAIRGLEPQLRSRNLSYRISHDGPVWTLIVSQPLQDIEEDLDRWEVSTESVEKSLFELPDIVAIAESYDASRAATTSPTFRNEVETAVDTGYTDSFTTYLASQTQVVRNSVGKIISHLKAGATGWQLDLVSLRRTRRMEQYQAVGYQLNLDTGLYVYSTAQLNLPAAVAFAVPATPADISDLFAWGWRKRSQRVELVGSYVEQTVELLFAPWSTLAYSPASSNLVW